MEDSENNSDVTIKLNTNQLNLKTEDTSTDTKNECINISGDIFSVSETNVKVENTQENNALDDDGEDLPDNFFDDFSNNDFMAGLDIVDDWVDDEEVPEKKLEKGNDYFQDNAILKSTSSDQKQNFSKSSKTESSPRYKSRFNDRDYTRREGRYSKEDDKMRRNFKRSYEKSRDKDERRRTKEREIERRRSRSRDRYRDECKSRDQLKIRDHERDYNKRASNVSNPKNNSKEKPTEEMNDSRRDPEKTKRDIQRDKLRCAKDFEARVFQEQIKVAESGLVPPGTELDVVLEHEKRKQQEEQAIIERPLERKKEEPALQPVEKRRSVDRFHGKDKTYSTNHGRYSREHFTRDQRSRERRSRERRSRERRSRERRSRERRSRERRSRERHIYERHSRERHTNERRSRERHTNERRSRERYSSERAQRNRKYSPEMRSRKREYDGIKRSRDRSISPYYRRSRSLNREELLRRNDDLRLRIREKRRERLMNELSPVSEARFSRSPSLSNMSLISNISEREFWLRNRDKYKSRYIRSCSPISSSSLSDLGSPRRKRSRKASFMEEIEKKLREKAKVHANSTNYGSPVFNHSEPPQPVPPPQQFQQAVHTGITFQSQNSQIFSQGIVPNPFSQPQVVDHGMMIHQSMSGLPMMNMISPAPIGTMGGTTSLTPTSVEQSMMMPQVLQVQQQSVLNSSVKIDSSVHRTASNLKPCVSDANKEVTKLFEEQKISLSDYLSVSAKPIDPKLPINVHKKIKVISKCQDVIRVLKDDSKLCGRFFPKPAPPATEKQEEKSVKWKSPLRKTLPVRFMFTTPCKKSATHQEFVRHIINKLLFVCGIPIVPEIPNIQSASVKPINTCTNTSSIPNIPPLSTSTQIPVQQISKKSPHFQKPVRIKYNSVGLQTDPVKCQICEIRSARTYSDESCQTIEKEMVDQSTQVTNEDLQKSIVTFTPRGILKNTGSNLQSLSHLTSAQLLSLQKEKTDDRNISSRNESFMSRNQQEQFNSPGNYMGRNQNNPPPLMSTNFNSGSIMNRSSSNFNSNFSGSIDKLPYNNMSSRSYSNASHSNQPTPMNSGNSINDFQAVGNRNVDRPNAYDRYTKEGYSSDDCYNDYNRNMGGNMSGNMGSSPISNRGRGGMSNRGYYMGNYGGQNRQFYN